MNTNLVKSSEDLKKENNKKAIAAFAAIIIFGAIFYFSMSKERTASTTISSPVVIQGLDGSRDSNKISLALDDLKTEKTKQGEQRLKSAEIIKAKNGSYEVIIRVRGDGEGVNQKDRNAYMRGMISRIFYSLYSKQLNVGSMSVSAVYPFTDENHKVSELSAYTAILDKKDASKINWQASRDEVISNVIPSLWKTGIVRAGFQD